MKLSRHIAASVAASSALYLVSGSREASAASLLSGIFIDLDHIADYFWSEKTLRFDLRDFFYKCDNFLLRKASLILHSYELAAALALVAWHFSNTVIAGVAFGFAAHLALDAYENGKYLASKAAAYFLIYRIIKRFDYGEIFKYKPDDSPDK